MLDPLTDLLNDDGFRTGVLYGAVATAVVVVVALVAAARGGAGGRRLLPWAGLAFGAATVAAIADRYNVPEGIVVGLVLLAVGGCAVGWWGPPAPRRIVVRMIAAAPGAVVVARAGATGRPDWAFPTLVAVTVVGGALAAECDRAHRARGLAPVMLAVSAFGAYATTPDTEHTAIMLGAAAPLALVGWPRPLASLGVGGSFVAAAVFGWVVVLDGVERDGAVVGGLACLGALVVEPVSRWIVRRSRGTTPAAAATTGHAALSLVAVHVALVAVCSRVAGLRASTAAALAISAIAYVAAGVVLAGLAGRPWGVTRRLRTQS
jgi:hypothetical protein